MEVLLSSLPSPSQVQQTATSAATTHTHPHPLPPELANFPAGTLIKGFVINREGMNQSLLRTPQGDLLMKSEFFLKTGSEVTIRLQMQQGQTQARIITVNGEPVQSWLSHQHHAGTTGRQSATTLSGTSTQAAISTPSVTTPPPLQAVLLQPAAYGSEMQSQQTIAHILRLTPSQQPGIQQGMKLQFRLANATLLPAIHTPASAPAPAQAAPSNLSLPSTKYEAYSKLASLPPSPLSSTPASSSTNASGASTGPMLSGQVIGHEGSETVVRTSIGTVKLFTPAALATGSPLQLEFVPFTPETPMPSTESSSQSRRVDQPVTLASRFAQEWDSLKESLHLLRQDAPAEATRLIERLPNTQSNLVNNVLFFLTALRGNDLHRWFGTTQSAKIEEKSPGLLQRLSGDFASLRVLTADQPDLPWQMAYFPLIHDDELHQARLYLRHEDGQAGADNEDETRFIFEVSLSALGEVQLDGLVHGPRQHRHFDLTLRSEQAFDEIQQNELRALYHRAADAVGFVGQLRFAAGREQLLQPLQDVRIASAGDEGSIMA